MISFSGRFANLNTLNTLKLCGNNITRPPKEALGSLQSLQNLYLNNNGLTTLKKSAFGNLPVVSTLELSGNKIFNVSYAAFEDLRQLTTIDLSSNNLSWVPPGAFLGKFYSQPKKACKISQSPILFHLLLLISGFWTFMTLLFLDFLINEITL